VNVVSSFLSDILVNNSILGVFNRRRCCCVSVCVCVCVCVFYQGSQYASNSTAAYDLFLTSAVTDGLKLWDLRSNRFISQPGCRVLINCYENDVYMNYSKDTALRAARCRKDHAFVTRPLSQVNALFNTYIVSENRRKTRTWVHNWNCFHIQRHQNVKNSHCFIACRCAQVNCCHVHSNILPVYQILKKNSQAFVQNLWRRLVTDTNIAINLCASVTVVS